MNRFNLRIMMQNIKHNLPLTGDKAQAPSVKAARLSRRSVGLAAYSSPALPS
jgi:hypothetical protein